VWAYWPVLGEVGEKWVSSPQYSHGWLVPVFSAFLLWRARKAVFEEARGPVWWGLAPLVVGVGLRLAGAVLYATWMEAVSLLAVLLGVALLLGGWQALRRSWVAVAFLWFMFPLPYRVETALSGPLQRVATVVSRYTLQTLGVPAFSEGNIIVVNEHRIGIVEACNGLGMLLLFFAMSVAAALLSRRPWTDRLVLVLSAAPIAVLANVVRIVATALLYEAAGNRWGDLSHDLAGWLMMPLALGLLWLEQKVMSFLLVDVPAEEAYSPDPLLDPMSRDLTHAGA
jgi:exosortase